MFQTAHFALCLLIQWAQNTEPFIRQGLSFRFYICKYDLSLNSLRFLLRAVQGAPNAQRGQCFPFGGNATKKNCVAPSKLKII
jgi:hypothetical protein